MLTRGFPPLVLALGFANKISRSLLNLFPQNPNPRFIECSLNSSCYTSTDNALYGDPCNRDDDVHALLFRSLPLVAVSPIFLVVPVSANCAVHATAAVLLWFRGRANVLDDGAVGNVLVRGLGRLGALGFDCCGANERFEDGLLDWY